MKTYTVQLRFTDRRLGPAGRTIQVAASGIPVAVAKATREFWRSLNRKERFDARKSLAVTATLAA